MEKRAEIFEIFKEELSKYMPEELEELKERFDHLEQYKDGSMIDDNINDPCEAIFPLTIKSYQIPEE